jgi:prepilin-type N-terminal cleavage/methylation domain-containing protein
MATCHGVRWDGRAFFGRPDARGWEEWTMKRRGLTLLELLVVLTILIALGTLIVPMIGGFGRKSQQLATWENLARLRDLIVDRYAADMDGDLPRPAAVELGSGAHQRKNHPQLRYLFINPDTRDITPTPNATMLSNRRWQGPYVKHGGARYRLDTDNNFTDTYGLGDDTTTGIGGDPIVVDAWGRPIVIQEPSTHGAFTPDATDRTYTRLVSAGPNGRIDTSLSIQMPIKAERGDDIVVFLFRHDEYGGEVLRLDQ